MESCLVQSTRTIEVRIFQEKYLYLRLWVDILTPEEAAKNPPEAITPPAPRDMEVRVIVWDTRNVILKDNDGKRSDILVVGIMEGQQPQSTDTHWNSKDGTGMFNWRMKFGTKIPGPNSRLKLQVWDRNVLTPNGKEKFIINYYYFS